MGERNPPHQEGIWLTKRKRGYRIYSQVSCNPSRNWEFYHPSLLYLPPPCPVWAVCKQKSHAWISLTPERTYQSSNTQNNVSPTVGLTMLRSDHRALGCTRFPVWGRAALVWAFYFISPPASTCTKPSFYPSLFHPIRDLSPGYTPFKCENCWTPAGLYISYSDSYKTMRGMLSNPV